jgi:cysteine synthase A
VPAAAPAPASALAAGAPVQAPVVADADAERFVSDAVRQHAVVMFALEWCEFCWTARKLFARLAVPFESIDVDAVRFQRDELGVRIRAALRQHTGSPTMPQIYVGGQHLGGCIDLLDAMHSGELQRRLDAAGVAHDRTAAFDPYGLLPKWMHPRQAA